MTLPTFVRKWITRRTADDAQWLSLLGVARTSWSLLSANEKWFFIIRVGARLSLNALDIVAVGLMGLLGALTATGLSGQRLNLFGYEIPQPSAANVVALVGAVAFLFILKGGLGILLAWIGNSPGSLAVGFPRLYRNQKFCEDNALSVQRLADSSQAVLASRNRFSCRKIRERDIFWSLGVYDHTQVACGANGLLGSGK